jgi:hypothetical protein
MTDTNVSIFNRSNIPWEGFGLNVNVDNAGSLSNQIHGQTSQWVRIYLEVNDPGIEGIYFDNDTFDSIWEQSGNIQTQLTRFTYSTFEQTGSKFIFTMKGAPTSWLTFDGTNELRGDALVAFSRFYSYFIINNKK